MLYAKLGGPALAKTVNLVSRSAAEEIVQEVFAKLWQTKMVFPDLKRAYAWVYKCCTNSAIDFIRNHNNSHVELDESHHGDIVSADTNDLELKAQAHEIWKQLVHAFDADEAAVFVHRNLEGLTQDEVAEVMQISRRTVNRLQEKIDEKIEKLRRQHNV